MRCNSNNRTYQQRQVYNRKMRQQDTNWISHSRWPKVTKPQNISSKVLLQDLFVPVLMILIAKRKTLQKIREQIIIVQPPQQSCQKAKVSTRLMSYLRSLVKGRHNLFICLLLSSKIWAENIFNPNITWMRLRNNI